MNKVIIVGEIKFGEKGCVHQMDMAQAMGVERVTSIPKDQQVTVVVGRLLGNKEPAVLKQAKALGVTIRTVDEVFNDDVRASLLGILALKPKLEVYEKAAFGALSAAKPAQKSGLDTTLLADTFPMPPPRSKKKGKHVAAA